MFNRILKNLSIRTQNYYGWQHDSKMKHEVYYSSQLEFVLFKKMATEFIKGCISSVPVILAFKNYKQNL